MRAITSIQHFPASTLLFLIRYVHQIRLQIALLEAFNEHNEFYLISS